MVVDLTAVAALITICSTAIVSIIHTVQQSRCTRISACCVSCERNVLNPTNDDEPIEEHKE